MGLFRSLRQKSAAHDERIYQAAYDKAVSKGKTPEEAAKKGQRAVRRRKSAIIGGVNS